MVGDVTFGRTIGGGFVMGRELEYGLDDVAIVEFIEVRPGTVKPRFSPVLAPVSNMVKGVRLASSQIMVQIVAPKQISKDYITYVTGIVVTSIHLPGGHHAG